MILLQAIYLTSALAGFMLPAMLLFYHKMLMSAVLQLRRLRLNNVDATRHDARPTEDIAAAATIQEQNVVAAINIPGDVAVGNIPVIQLRDPEAELLPPFIIGFFVHIALVLGCTVSAQVAA